MKINAVDSQEKMKPKEETFTRINDEIDNDKRKKDISKQ